MVCRIADGVRHFILLGKEGLKMKNMGCCPKCHSRNIVRVPDNAHRYLAHSIAITKVVTVERVPVARYVCCDCGYVESWVENQHEMDEIKKTFG